MDAELRRELNNEVPGALSALGAADQAKLARVLRAAKQRQQQHLIEGIDEALKHIPALLRGPIRKLFE